MTRTHKKQSILDANKLNTHCSTSGFHNQMQFVHFFNQSAVYFLKNLQGVQTSKRVIRYEHDV